MNKMNRIFTLLLLGLLTTICCNAKNYYVKTNGQPNLTGTSWGWATNDLQAAINKAATGAVIYVAAGIYYGGFVMKEGVTVQGGYTANSSNPAERYDMAGADSSHFSILDGEGRQRPLTQLVPFSTPTVWDGFVIRNGKPAAVFKVGSIIYSQTGDNKITGVLYQYDTETKNGKMIGTKVDYKPWGGYEKAIDGLPPLINAETAKNNLTGAENTSAIVHELKQNSVDFSTPGYSGNGNYAAYWCDTLTSGGYTEWHLPAPGELQQACEANIQTILTSVGCDWKYPSWTSGQVGHILAWAYCLGDGSCHPALKYKTYSVSAVHAFTEPEQPNGIYFAGGGVFLYANGILKNCIVTNNTSSSKGGGVYCRGGQVIDCKIEGNDAPEGKEIYYESVSDIRVVSAPTLNVYPNPAQAGEKLNIDCPGAGICNYRIIDLSGKIIDSGHVDTEKTISAPFRKGIYILHLQSEKINLSKKLIIN